MLKKAKKLLVKSRLNSPLTKGMLIYSFGNLGSKAINFAVYPILTFYLIKSDLGYYDLIVNSIFLVIPLTTFQISDGIYRAVLPLSDINEQKRIINNGFNFSLISTISLIFLILWGLNFFFPIQYIYIVFAMGFSFAVNQSFKQIVRGLKKNINYVISDILYSFSFILCLIISLEFARLGLQGVLFSFVTANVISILYLLLSTPLFSYLKVFQPPTKNYYRPLLKYSVPLIPNTLSWWLVGSANTYIITIILGLGANGIYAVAFKFSSIIYILNKIFTLAWQDQLIGGIDTDSYYNSKIFNRLISVLLILVAIISVLTKPILGIIVTDDFYVVWKYVPFLLLATVCSSISSYFGAFYLKWKKTNKIFLTTLLGAIVAVISSILLTKLYGLIGTSISMAFGFGTVAFARYWDTRKKLKLKLKYNLIPLVLVVVLAIAINFTL